MNKLLLSGLLAILVSMPVFAYTQEADAPAAPAEEVAATEVPATDEPVEVGNKICPVSGEKVGGMGDIVKQEHNGKVYNLCCAMCAKDFSKDPEKFAKIADDEVKEEAAPAAN